MRELAGVVDRALSGKSIQNLNGSFPGFQNESTLRVLVKNMTGMLNKGISVRSGALEVEGSEREARVVLRSYSNILSSVSSEQSAFDALLRESESARSRPLKAVPPSELRPILRTVWSGVTLPAWALRDGESAVTLQCAAPPRPRQP